MACARARRSEQTASCTCGCTAAPRARPRTLAGEVLRLQRAAGNAAVGRLLARQPQPPEERLPPRTGPKEGEPPEMTGCTFGWKDGEWVWSCEGGGFSLPDIPLDPRRIPGKLEDLFPKDKRSPPGPFPTPKGGPWLDPPISVEAICRMNPLSPICLKPPPARKPEASLPYGVFYGWDVLFEHDQPAGARGGMTADGEAAVRWVIEHLRFDPTLQVRLVGHASSEGTPQQNLALSERRARAVQAALEAEGLGARVMDFVGGEDPPGCRRLEFGVWACGEARATQGEARPEDRKVTATFLRNRPVRLGPLLSP